ncbi:hypothetical protein SLA2020_131800 [Shorea laevis]
MSIGDKDTWDNLTWIRVIESDHMLQFTMVNIGGAQAYVQTIVICTCHNVFSLPSNWPIQQGNDVFPAPFAVRALLVGPNALPTRGE